MKSTGVYGGVYDEAPFYTFFKCFTVRLLRLPAIRCIGSIFYNFFFRQYLAAWLPGRVPVSSVDHPLDKKIPFVPAWVTIYLDFVFFWIRMLAFLLHRYGRASHYAVKEFINSMNRLYAFAAETYRRNFSTTRRPFYIARPRFFLIHLVDPHLMCIPSLHVMVVVHTWLHFSAILRSLGEDDTCAAQIEEMKQGALAISRAILYVKQHSVNCISAALYALCCFEGDMFPPQEAEAFASLLFSENESGGCVVNHTNRRNGKQANAEVRPSASPSTRLPQKDAAEITAYIISLFRRFISERKAASAMPPVSGWEEPLLRFMRQI